MQSHGRILGRTGAAHAAGAVVPEQDGGAQAPADPPRPGLRPAPTRLLAGALPGRLAAIDVGVEGLQGLVPGAEAPEVRGRRIARQSRLPDQLRAERLPAELAPDLGKVLEQIGLGDPVGLANRQAGGRQRPVPRAEAADQRLGGEAAMPVVDRGSGRKLAGLPGDAPQVLQQHLARRIPEMQSDVETRSRGSGKGHPKLIRPTPAGHLF